MKTVKTKPSKKQVAAARIIRNIPKAVAVNVVKTAKNKAERMAEKAADYQYQGQDSTSPAVQASGQMLTTSERIVKSTAQGAGKTAVAAYRFVKKHEQAKGAQKLQDIAPLEDTAPQSATDAPAPPQADIKTRPQPEAFAQTKLPTEQPPSPKVRFVEDAAPRTQSPLPRTRADHAPPVEAATPSAPIKQRAVQAVKTKQVAAQGLQLGHAPKTGADIAAQISAAPAPEAASVSSLPNQTPTPTSTAIADIKQRAQPSVKNAVQTIKIKEASTPISVAPAPEGASASSLPNQTPTPAPTAIADIKQRAQPSVNHVAQTIKIKEAVTPISAAPAPEGASASSLPNQTPPPSSTAIADIKQRAQPSVKNVAQKIKTKETVAPTSIAPRAQKVAPLNPATPHTQPHAADTAIPVKQQRKGQSAPKISARAPQEVMKTKRVIPDAPSRAVHSFDAAPTSATPIQDARIKTASPGKPAQRRTVKTRGKAVTKALHRTVKQEGRGIKTAAQTAAKARQSAKAAQKTAQQTARAAKAAAQKAVQAAKVVTKAVVSAIKAFLAAMKSLVAAIAALGSTALVILIIISLVAVIAGSVLGIFMAAEPSGHGTPVSEVTSLLNEEYYKKISEIQTEIKHDKVEIRASDGVMGVKWEDVLAIYSCKLAASDDPMEVVTFDKQKKEILRGILWDMNAVDYETRVETKYIEIPVLDEDGNQIYNEDGEPLMDKEYYTETTLIITVAHKTTDEMAVAYAFTPKQYEALALLREAGYASLWGKLLGGLVNGNGEIIAPDTDWTGTDIFAWPLPQSFRISSPFGYRKDPFTGAIAFHCGTDIAAPFGTPVLAAAGGTVTVANATDPWGMSYGYHVKINHGGGQETLYAHASSICVTAGQDVQAGEVIGYVGSTGNSNGNHLHFEVRINGKTTDAMGCFKQ